MINIYKHIKDSKLYIIYYLDADKCVAIPFNHDGKSITNCAIKDFIPIADLVSKF
jgi:hypothetical protein